MKNEAPFRLTGALLVASGLLLGTSLPAPAGRSGATRSGTRWPVAALGLLALLGSPGAARAQSGQGTSRFAPHEISLNGFRNPSIGLEYRYHRVSVHGGYYPTNFTSGRTTSFLKAGATLWFLPVGHRSNPSSFYLSGSYVRGLDREYTDKNGAALDLGFRWMAWRGLNLRLGVLALQAPGQSLKINPTPGISYSFFPGQVAAK